MKKLVTPLLITSFLLSQSAYALMCTKTYAQVTTGMTAAQVKAACGNPTSVQQKRQDLFENEQVEFWNYSSDIPTKHTATAMEDLGYVNEPVQSKQFTFDKEGKVTAISIGGGSMDSTSACGGMIKIGDNRSLVSSYCGKPSQATAGQKRIRKGSVVNEIWIYQFDEFRPPVSLTFEKGVLVNIAE